MPINRINVLVFPAGAENALEIHDSLKYNIHVNVYGASGKPDHARYVYPQDHYIEGDLYIDRESFLSTFNSILKQHAIDVVIPTHDTITLFFAKHASEIQARVVASAYETAAIAREKRLTYERFAGEDFCPHMYTMADRRIPFPVFLKPNIGQGSRGTWFLKNRAELRKASAVSHDQIICEYLPGKELTVDCFTDRHRKLLFVGPRTRERIQMGISFHSESLPLTKEIAGIAKTLNDALVFRGGWFFQVKQDATGKFKLLEISARQAGTMALYRQLGVNFALLSVFDVMGMDVTVVANRMAISLDRCLKNRYRMSYSYKWVYVDFDDTIVVKGKVNCDLIRFLYQCRNRGIGITLLTRHEADIFESLVRHAIAKELFDDIVVVPENREKHEYLSVPGAIYIDNYFPDRKKVNEICRIPVFDVDAVDSLLE